MKISYNWLKQYLHFNLSVEETADVLIRVGLEVEAIEKWESVKGGLDGLKIGVINSVVKHPDADKLSVTMVNVGSATDLQIVCGAPNVTAGQKVIVATDGTVVHPIKNEPFKIKKTKIRGVESNGMICADDEIGLSEDHSGLHVLPSDASVGTLVKDYFKIESDYVFEIGLTPNRGDAMSHIGTARDLAAFLIANKNVEAVLQIPQPKKPEHSKEIFNVEVRVENTEACPRYSGITITNVTVDESPAWIQNKLKAVGLRPINSIVDITIYVMWECGQPLHAFDADKIAGKKVIVKTLAEGTPFRTLDDKEIKLSSGDLMICDANEGMCIAGVYGGIKSGVTEKTKNIFLESACFNPKFIRRTATKHLLRTDAAMHFEKGTDPNNTVYALQRAAELICEISGGKISSDVIDVYPQTVKEKEVTLIWEKLNRIAGVEIPKANTKKILQALEFKIVKEDDRAIVVATPTFKTDVTMAEDVVEEILRINGLEKIEVADAVHSSISSSEGNARENFQQVISGFLAASGFSEMINNSLTNSKYHEQYFSEKKDELIRLLSYSNAGIDSMRTSMIFSALEVIQYNLNRKSNDLKLFEFGKTYHNEDSKYHERSKLILLTTGNIYEESWQLKSQSAGFYFLKGITENVLERCGILKFSLAEKENKLYSESLSYSLGNNHLVSLGKLNSKILSDFDIKKEVWYAEFDADALFQFSKQTTSHTEPSKLPAVRRDLALVIDDKIKYEDIRTLAFKTGRPLLQETNLFDVFAGEKIGAGKKSYAISFILLDKERTLADKDVDAAMNKLISIFESELGAQVRSS